MPRRPYPGDVSAETRVSASAVPTLTAALLLAACSTPIPWARTTPATADQNRGEYEVRCAECTVTYRVPGEGERRTEADRLWRRGVFVRPGEILSLTATVPEAGPRHRTVVRILVDGRVEAADTLRVDDVRRSLSVTHAVRRVTAGR